MAANPNKILMPANNKMINDQLREMQLKLNDQNQEKQYISMIKKLETFENGAVIKQKYELMQGLTGCEFPNVYSVYKKDSHGKPKGQIQLKYKEKSTYCDRCISSTCKPFNINVYNISKDFQDEIGMRCTKECACSYCCCNRQEMQCWYYEKGEEKFLGRCFDNCDPCDFIYEIYDNSGSLELNADFFNRGKLDYIVKSNCCQLYFWCRCPCRTCNEITFEIFDNVAAYQSIGKLVRYGRECCQSSLIINENADQFKLDFPKLSDWRKRAMLINLCVFIDYALFEESSDRNNGGYNQR